jgi:hypothetical protein
MCRGQQLRRLVQRGVLVDLKSHEEENALCLAKAAGKEHLSNAVKLTQLRRLVKRGVLVDLDAHEQQHNKHPIFI